MSIKIATPGIHHLALRVTDLARSRRFYADVLEFPVVLEGPGIFLFLAGQTAIGVRGPDAATGADDVFDPFRVGLDHVALGCVDARELERVAAALSAAGVESTGVKLDATLNRQYVAFKDPDRIAWEFYMAPDAARASRDDKIAVAESYISGLGAGDLSGVPFASDVRYESPLSPPRVGREAIDFLSGLLPLFRGARVRQHVVEDDYVASVFELHTANGVTTIFDKFKVVDGQLKEINPFYDPSVLMQAVTAAGAGR